MERSCPISCDSCERLSSRQDRCKRDWTWPPAIAPGGVDRMFERLLEMHHSHEVNVLSRPPDGQVRGEPSAFMM